MVNSWHILHLFPDRSWGGAEMQMVDLADWQRNSGLDAKVWCVPGSPIDEECRRRGLPTVLDPFPFHGVIPRLWTLWRVLRREKTTHLHVHWASGVRLVYGIKWLLRVRLIFYTHMWITRRKMDFLHRCAYGEFDKVTVSGARALDNVQKFLPWRMSQLELCPYGLDFSKMSKDLRQNGRADARTRRKWALPEEDLIFGFYGRIDRQKGVKEFLLAALPLLAEFPKLNLLVVGSPTLNERDAQDYNSEIEQLISESPHRDRVHRRTHQREFLSILACADLAVLPSYMECYSILIVQCFALGIPVVSTNAGGTPDLVAEPSRGWLVPSQSVVELREVLGRLATNPGEVWSKASDCIEYAHTHHDYRKVTARMVEIYQAAAEHAPESAVESKV